MLKVFESFAGYGSQALALRNIGVDYQVVGISEIDKYALMAYEQLHGHCPNFGDIREIDWSKVPDFDLFTMSSPCQDFSIAGMRAGGSEGSGTRSSLLWECRRAIVEKRPRYILFENVKGLVSKKFLPYFLKWQNELSHLGYTNFAQILNAKHYGVAQNRERVFMVSILGNAWYDFPQKQRLTKCLADYLEPKVDAKYYLSEKVLRGFRLHAERHAERGNGFGFKPKECHETANTIQTTGGNRSTDNYIKVAGNLICTYQERGRVYDIGGLNPTINTCEGAGREPKILQRGRGNNRGGSYDICPTISKSAWEQNNLIQLNQSIESGGKQPYQQNRVYHTGGIVPAIGTTNVGNIVSCAMRGRVQKDSMLIINDKIRRLTPRECFRLMGVSDSDFDKLSGISDTQLYKLAGNSIVVPVLEEIFKQLLHNTAFCGIRQAYDPKTTI